MKYLKTKIEKLIENNEDLILCFHIGRGGDFHGAGHLTFEGEKTIEEFTDNLFLNEDETQYTDSNGNEVGLPTENDGTGRIEIDGDYDTTYCIHVEDLTEDEFDAIKNRGRGFYGLSMEEFDAISYFDDEEEIENEE